MPIHGRSRRLTPFLFLWVLLALACSLTSPSNPPTPASFRATLSAQAQERVVIHTPEPTRTSRPTATHRPTNTLAPTRTVTATPLPSFTPTANPHDRLPEYAQACEEAMKKKAAAGRFVPPMLVIFQSVGEQPDWQLGGLAEEPLAFVTSNADQASTLVCVRQTRVEKLTYDSGAIGYQRDWDVRVVSWPEGLVVAVKLFRGSRPPGMVFVRKGTKVIYGDEPSTSGLLRWLAENMEAPDVMVSGLPIGDIAFAKTGGTLYTLSPPLTLQTWEIGGRVPIKERQINFHHPLRLSPSGEFIGSGTLEEGFQAALLDVRTGNKIRQFVGPSGLFDEIAFSADGSVMAVSNYSGNISIWQTTDGQPLARIEAGLGFKEIALSPDGSLIATGSTLYDLCIYSTHDGSLQRKIEDSSRVIDLVFSPVLQPDGSALLTSAHKDGSVRVWQVASGALLAKLEDCAQKKGFLEEPLNTGDQVVFSPDGKLLAAACNVTWLWRTSDWALDQKLERFEDIAAVLAFSPDGRWLATGTQRGLVFLWPIAQP